MTRPTRPERPDYDALALRIMLSNDSPETIKRSLAILRERAAMHVTLVCPRCGGAVFWEDFLGTFLHADMDDEPRDAAHEGMGVEL